MAEDCAIKTSRTVSTRTTFELSARGIRDLLRATGHFDVPADARVTVTVPGGGDWSGMELSIGEDAPLTVTWTTTIEEG